MLCCLAQLQFLFMVPLYKSASIIMCLHPRVFVWLDLQQVKGLAQRQAVQPAPAMADSRVANHCCNHSPPQQIDLGTGSEYALLIESTLTGCSLILQPVPPNVYNLQWCLHVCCDLDHTHLLD